MKIRGMTDPGHFTVENIPGTNRSLVRLYQNVTPIKEEGFEGFEYNEYHVEVETWDGIAQNVMDNYNEFLKKGTDNEIDRSNEALFQASQDVDIILVDQEYRLTLLELGITDINT